MHIKALGCRNSHTTLSLTDRHSLVMERFREICALRNPLDELVDELAEEPVEDDNLLPKLVRYDLLPTRIVRLLKEGVEDIIVVLTGDSLNAYDGVLVATCIDLALHSIEILHHAPFRDALS